MVQEMKAAYRKGEDGGMQAEEMTLGMQGDGGGMQLGRGWQHIG